MKNKFVTNRTRILIVSIILLIIGLDNQVTNAAIVNQKAFGSIQCVPYAYADFNADKLVDIYCVSKPGHFIEIWIAQESMDPLFLQYKKTSLKNNSTIVNIVPGDFNGDSIIDMLVVYKAKDNKFEMSLFLGKKVSRYENDLEPEIQLGITVLDQPFATDVDGDGKIDLLVQSKDSKGNNVRKILKFSEHGSIVLEIIQEAENELYPGYAHSLTDFNNDFTPDMLLVSKPPKSDKLVYEKWMLDTLNLKREYEFQGKYDAPPNMKHYGQSLYADFDSDGSMEHLLPVCKDSDCQESAIMVYKNNVWSEIRLNLGSYGFIPPNKNEEFWNKNAAMSVKIGDYDLNGYLDLLMVLRDHNSTNSGVQSAILMKNVEGDSKKPFKRAFKIDNHMTSLFSYKNVVQVSFFDLYDDGYLDVLLTLKETDPSGKNPSYRLTAFKNEYFDDVYFIKVMVIPGTCSIDECPHKNLPYGLNYPGALVRMETSSYEYQKVVLYATQLSQSSHMSLQLPYTIFGLGATPNFVEELKVGFLALSKNYNIKGIGKEWRQIIPNSQLVINPFPRHKPSQWKMQLFITPSKNILKTAISLAITMIILIIAISILQFREKKMDEKERKAESQRFHFDGL